MRSAPGDDTASTIARAERAIARAADHAFVGGLFAGDVRRLLALAAGRGAGVGTALPSATLRPRLTDDGSPAGAA